MDPNAVLMEEKMCFSNIFECDANVTEKSGSDIFYKYYNWFYQIQVILK